MLVRFIIIILIIIVGILWYLSYKRAKTTGNMPNKTKGGANEADAKEFDPYAILQVPRNATQAEIHKAWLDLASQYHPDKVTHLGPELQKLAEQRFKEIQRAYHILKKD